MQGLGPFAEEHASTIAAKLEQDISAQWSTFLCVADAELMKGPWQHAALVTAATTKALNPKPSAGWDSPRRSAGPGTPARRSAAALLEGPGFQGGLS